MVSTNPNLGHRGSIDAARRACLAVAGLSTVLTAGWVSAALLMTRRGYDITDEGFYLLSYRWWSTSPRTFTGVQYIYGPVFGALDWDIPDLRAFRVVTILAAHAIFGVSFMRWLRLHRPWAPDTRWWEAAGALTIVATGGLIYGWMPISPGYNDLVVIATLLLASCLLCVVVRVEEGRRVGSMIPVIMGSVAFGMVLTKWSSGLAVGGILALSTGALMIRLARNQAAALLLASALGFAATAALFHMFVMPLNDVLPQMLEANKSMSTSGHTPLETLRLYASTTTTVLGTSLLIAFPSLVVAALMVAFGWHRSSPVRAALITITPLWILLIFTGAWVGGSEHLRVFSSGLFASSMLVVGAAAFDAVGRARAANVAARAGGARTFAASPVFLLLAAAPMIQGLGTSNPLYAMVVNCYAPWSALAIAAITRDDAITRFSRLMAIGATAATTGLAVSVGITGVLLHPYRTGSFRESNVRASAVPILSDMLVEAPVLAEIVQLRQTLGPYLRPGISILGLDDMPGIVLALDGRPAGEGWVSVSAPRRLESNYRYLCQDARLTGRRRPILLFNRPVSSIDRSGLALCGLHLSTDYVRLPYEPPASANPTSKVEEIFVPR